jgi:hypothetical protein
MSPDPSCDWLDELDVSPGPPHLRMGLRTLPIEKWLPTDAHTPHELEHKARLLDEHTDLVQLDDGWDHAIEELIGLMEISLGQRIDRRAATSAHELLDAAGRAVPEDLILMARDDEAWRLIGGSLVFPNQWQLSEKMGQTLAEIHGPVDGYETLLSDKVDRFFDRLAVNRIVWRRNWFFHDIDEFFQPDRMVHATFDEPERAATLTVRSEWQTLRRLAFSGVMLFTVKTQVAPMAQVAARPAVAAAMAAFLEAGSTVSHANKDALGRVDPIVEWLRASAASA